MRDPSVHRDPGASGGEASSRTFTVITPARHPTTAMATMVTTPVVLLAPETETALPAEVVELLVTDELGIGAVVPAVVNHQGQLLEAGAEHSADGLVAAGAGLDPALSSYRMRRNVAGTTYPWMAVRSDLISPLDLDSLSADPQAAVDAVVDRVRGAGMRITYEPTWTVIADLENDRELAPAALAPVYHTASRDILVVSAFVPGDPFRFEDRSLSALVADLIDQVSDARITFVAADGFRAEPAAEALRKRGVEVVHGPLDWRRWFTAQTARFSHVYLTWTGLRSDLGWWIRHTQAQAVKVLYLPSLPFRDAEALRPYTPAEEMAGLDCVRVELEARLSSMASWVDAVWCDQEIDAAFVRGLRIFPAISIIPPAVHPPRAHPAPHRDGARRGVVLVASEGHDVLEANEDGALFSLGHLLASLRRRRPDLPCTVLSEAPTPRLETACRAANAQLVSLDQGREAIDQAALVVVGHQYGTGGQVGILAALESGTPFVTTPIGAGNLALGGLTSLAVFASVPDLVLHARRLLDDGTARNRFLAEMRRLTAGPLSLAARIAALRIALPSVALSPAPHPRPSWPTPVTPATPRPPLLFVDLRPESMTANGVTGTAEPETETDRYDEWCRRWGPNELTLTILSSELEALTYRPKVSILMPVYNTDPVMLRQAIASVRDQIYTGWQLCIADDGSDRADTLAVLEELIGEPAVDVIHLRDQVGISEATNAALALADGEFVAFLDHDDILKPHALAQNVRWLNADPSLDVVYSDEDQLDRDGTLINPHLKPDWSPDRLMSYNYVCHLTVMRRSLVEKLGGLRSAFDGSQDYDLILRASEHTGRIAHIPEPLYTWRILAGSSADVADAKPYALTAAKRALGEALERRGHQGHVDDTNWAGRYRTRYAIVGQPKVSIIIPTKDGAHLLRRCIGSILEKTTYRNYELVIIDNQSADGDTLGFLASLPARVVRYPHRFNYARMLNLAAATTECEALLFLNNDTEVITPGWIEGLVEHAMRPEVGAVGGRLFFGDGRPQHEGILVGMGSWAWNIDHHGYWQLGEAVRDVSAVTGACTMIRPSVYARVGGNDERLRVAYNDVDICLRVRQAGLQVVYTPYAELYHYESSTRSGYEHEEDGPLFGLRWEPRQRVDPYYSPLYHADIPFRIDLTERHLHRELSPLSPAALN